MVKIKLMIKDFENGKNLNVVFEPMYKDATPREKKLAAAYLIYLAQISNKLRSETEEQFKDVDTLDLKWVTEDPKKKG